jgi:type IV pilus assembly protein PilV
MRDHQGFTLIEALVAMLVAAVALGGIATLLVQAIRHERDAAQQAIAVRLAAGLSEQLRALPRPDRRPLASVASADAGTACADAPSACPAELAATEAIAAWLDEVGKRLSPAASAAVDVVAGPSPAYVITLEWPSLHEARSRLRLRVET